MTFIREFSFTGSLQTFVLPDLGLGQLSIWLRGGRGAGDPAIQVNLFDQWSISNPPPGTYTVLVGGDASGRIGGYGGGGNGGLATSGGFTDGGGGGGGSFVYGPDGLLIASCGGSGGPCGGTTRDIPAPGTWDSTTNWPLPVDDFGYSIYTDDSWDIYVHESQAGHAYWTARGRFAAGLPGWDGGQGGNRNPNLALGDQHPWTVDPIFFPHDNYPSANPGTLFGWINVNNGLATGPWTPDGNPDAGDWNSYYGWLGGGDYGGSGSYRRIDPRPDHDGTSSLGANWIGQGGSGGSGVGTAGSGPGGGGGGGGLWGGGGGGFCDWTHPWFTGIFDTLEGSPTFGNQQYDGEHYAEWGIGPGSHGGFRAFISSSTGDPDYDSFYGVRSWSNADFEIGGHFFVPLREANGFVRIEADSFQPSGWNLNKVGL